MAIEGGMLFHLGRRKQEARIMPAALAPSRDVRAIIQGHDYRGRRDDAMNTRLDGPLKREIEIDKTPYTLTITPAGMTLALKGRRKGFDLRWSDLVSGDAALATALNASLTARLTAIASSNGRKAPAKPAKRKPSTR